MGGVFLFSGREVGEELNPVRLVLAVLDELYMEPFLQYVHGSEFERRLIITGFSQQDAFVKYMKDSGELVDVLLAEPEFLDHLEATKWGRLTAIALCEREESVSGLSLPKYQPLHQLLSAVLSIAQGDLGKKEGSEGKADVIGVHSVVGGLGKTTVALNIARQLAVEGAKVFYLNLETVSNRLLFEGQNAYEGQPGGLARLLYDLKAAAEEQHLPKLPISAYASRHPLLQGDTFAPLDNLNEMLELQRQEAVDLIEFIAASGLYDAVIVDSDSYPNGRTEAVLECADKLVWLVTDDENVMRKTGLWFHHLEHSHPALYSDIMKKSLLTVNRYVGEMTTSLPVSGMMIEVMLSYISAWKNGFRQASALYSPLYQRDVQQLCRRLYRDTGVLQGGNGAR